MQGLYLVTPNWDDTERMVACTAAALDAGAALVQYRHKDASAALRREQGAALLALCLTLGADGVHVGGTDASVREARAALGPDLIVGASCYGDLELARAAQQDGATYAAFGGFYPSPVKRYTFTTDPDLLVQARGELTLPLVVIGGMTPHNAAPLVERGADMVAAITSVYLADDPAASVRQFNALFAANRKTSEKSEQAL